MKVQIVLSVNGSTQCLGEYSDQEKATEIFELIERDDCRMFSGRMFLSEILIDECGLDVIVGEKEL